MAESTMKINRSLENSGKQDNIQMVVPRLDMGDRVAEMVAHQDGRQMIYSHEGTDRQEERGQMSYRTENIGSAAQARDNLAVIPVFRAEYRMDTEKRSSDGYNSATETMTEEIIEEIGGDDRSHGPTLTAISDDQARLSNENIAQSSQV